mgnify:CR=1 FL=1
MNKLRIDLAVRAAQPEPEESVLDIQIEIAFTFFSNGVTHKVSRLNPSTALMAGIAFVFNSLMLSLPFIINVETRRLLTTPLPKIKSLDC